MSSDKVLQLKLTEHLLQLLQGEYAALNEVQLYEVFTHTLQLRRLDGREPHKTEPTRGERLRFGEEEPSSADIHQLSTRPGARAPLPAPPKSQPQAPPQTLSTREEPTEKPASRRALPARPHASWEDMVALVKARTPTQQWKQREAEHPLRALLQSAAVPGDNILAISSKELSCLALFQTGSLVEVHPRRAEQDISLLDMLVEQGRLSPEQRQQAQLYMERDQVDEDEALLQGHLLGYPQVLRALQQRLTLWVQRLMRLEGARFALYPMPRLPRHYSTPPVSLARVAYQMRRQEVAQLSADQLLAQSQHLRGKQIACVATPFSVHELQLAPDELRLHQKLSEDGYTLEELLEDGPMQEEPLRVTLLAFLHLDMARLRPERSLQMFRGELRQQRLFLAGADHFEALGVHWSAHQEEIEEAWGRMQRRWGPRQLPSGAGQAVREQLEQMRARLATSYQKLRADTCRRAYREQLITPEQLKDAIQLYYRQGDAALLRKNYDEAESCMLRVLELDPRHGGARVKLKAAQDRRPRAGQ